MFVNERRSDTVWKHIWCFCKHRTYIALLYIQIYSYEEVMVSAIIIEIEPISKHYISIHLLLNVGSG